VEHMVYHMGVRSFSRLARSFLSITVFSFNIQIFSYEGGPNTGIHGDLI
jgi:hypothetical protein